MQKLSNGEVYRIIKRGFKDFVFVAYDIIKTNWNKITPEERSAALRSARYINEVSKVPEKSFSRIATYRDWMRRGAEYAAKYGINPKTATFYIVQDPTGCVMSHAEWAFINNSDVNRLFYQFCATVQNWEYSRTSKSAADRADAYRAAQKIVELSKKIYALADIAASHVLSRGLAKQY